jgi:hypothetical protein
VTHTPGPWRVFDSPGIPDLGVAGPTKDDGTAVEVCIMAVGDDHRFDAPGPERKANARLIAAAPAMLAALDRVGRYFEQHGTADTQGIACDVFQALTAATGGARA